MKKLIALLFVVALLSASATDFDQIQKNHKLALKYLGHADKLVQKGITQMPMMTKNGPASVIYSDNFASLYMEKGDEKFTYNIEPMGDGKFKITITVKLPIIGQKTFVFIVSMNGKKFSIEAVDNGEKLNYWCLLGCVGSNIGLISQCGSDLSCWLQNAPGIYSCITGCF